MLAIPNTMETRVAKAGFAGGVVLVINQDHYSSLAPSSTIDTQGGQSEVLRLVCLPSHPIRYSRNIDGGIWPRGRRDSISPTVGAPQRGPQIIRELSGHVNRSFALKTTRRPRNPAEQTNEALLSWVLFPLHSRYALGLVLVAQKSLVESIRNFHVVQSAFFVRTIALPSFAPAISSLFLVGTPALIVTLFGQTYGRGGRRRGKTPSCGGGQLCTSSRAIARQLFHYPMLSPQSFLVLITPQHLYYLLWDECEYVKTKNNGQSTVLNIEKRIGEQIKAFPGTPHIIVSGAT
ncbi:hypothetical protein DL93DRAFT_2220207 [Clavulina sp. PMI_390]|nr:hypothetical protein DL93DRAFT_2220207 [Clavulina sp. PMI_390]